MWNGIYISYIDVYLPAYRMLAVSLVMETGSKNKVKKQDLHAWNKLSYIGSVEGERRHMMPDDLRSRRLPNIWGFVGS